MVIDNPRDDTIGSAWRSPSGRAPARSSRRRAAACSSSLTGGSICVGPRPRAASPGTGAGAPTGRSRRSASRRPAGAAPCSTISATRGPASPWALLRRLRSGIAWLPDPRRSLSGGPARSGSGADPAPELSAADAALFDALKAWRLRRRRRQARLHRRPQPDPRGDRGVAPRASRRPGADPRDRSGLPQPARERHPRARRGSRPRQSGHARQA